MSGLTGRVIKNNGKYIVGLYADNVLQKTTELHYVDSVFYAMRNLERFQSYEFFVDEETLHDLDLFAKNRETFQQAKNARNILN